MCGPVQKTVQIEGVQYKKVGTKQASIVVNSVNAV